MAPKLNSTTLPPITLNVKSNENDDMDDLSNVSKKDIENEAKEVNTTITTLHQPTNHTQRLTYEQINAHAAKPDMLPP